MTDDLRNYSPATASNREPIREVLIRIVPQSGPILEIASGTGEHAAFFAAALPLLTWQPTDREARALSSIAAHREAAGLPNLLPPIALDVTSPNWPIARADMVVCINMIHISPWAACEALIRGAAGRLPDNGILYLYGPFKIGGEHTADSNRRFDEDLRSRDPSWGIRDLDEVASLAADHGLTLTETVAMPANNLSVIFRRQK